ncbi:MAG: mechanosensitive ion channel family protein [archaeon]
MSAPTAILWFATLFEETVHAIAKNTLEGYLSAAGIFVVCFALCMLFKRFVMHRLKKLAEKTKNDIDDILLAGIDRLRWPFFLFLSFYLGETSLVLPVLIDNIFKYAFLFIGVYYAVRFFQGMVNFVANKEIEKRKTVYKGASTSMVIVLRGIIIFIMWVIAGLIILTNLGVKLTPVIAGLGIGGIAIAFALQNVLSDLFSSFSIYFDKPFVEGDFIDIGPEMGTVKHIGLKSTRLQDLQGEELVVPNKLLTDSKIHNYKKMDKRRVVVNLGVEYDTPTSKLMRGKQLITDILKKQKDVTLDRVHFKDFGDFSLQYELVYFVQTPDYVTYMDAREHINFSIKKAFEKEKISMAFPTQTIILKK